MPSVTSAASARQLDFVVIGAQKSGTTTLFEHLRQHPQLYIPPGKEAAFFSRDDLFGRGVGALFELFFPNAPPGRLLGTVTPAYMCDVRVAERLHRSFPSTKLIAILRDPIERARSHFMMATRRGQESRTFQQAIISQLGPISLAQSRSRVVEADSYVIWGEYGRVLSLYLEFFGSEQLCVVQSKSLENDPVDVLHNIYEFLGVTADLPATVFKRYHVGRGSQRLPNLQRRAERSPVKWVWRRLPQNTRDRLFYRFEMWNVSARTTDIDLSLPNEVEAVLRQHYHADAMLLLETTGVRVPWLDW